MNLSDQKLSSYDPCSHSTVEAHASKLTTNPIQSNPHR